MLYWSLPLGAMLGKIRFWKLQGARNDAYGWYSCLRVQSAANKALRLGRLTGHQSLQVYCIEAIVSSQLCVSGGP